jgi:uncharacterized protein YkwD
MNSRTNRRTISSENAVTPARRTISSENAVTPARRSTALLAALVAALVALGVVRPVAAQASTTSAPAFATAVLNLLNSERSAHHLAALRMNSHLLQSAHAHNLRMASANVMSHQLSGEPALGTRITSAGYRWSSIGENIAWNSDRTQNGALALETMMYNEVAPNNGHRLNILSTRFKDVGIDVVIDTTHGKLWLTEDFASP